MAAWCFHYPHLPYLLRALIACMCVYFENSIKLWKHSEHYIKSIIRSKTPHIWIHVCHLWLAHDPQNSPISFRNHPQAHTNTLYQAWISSTSSSSSSSCRYTIAVLHTDMCWAYPWLCQHEYHGNYIKLQKTACNSYWFLLNLSTCFDHCLLFCMLMTSNTLARTLAHTTQRSYWYHTHPLVVFFSF